ncbi:MAG: FAD-dependent oxidoreductase [Mariprofundaceae bacterium]
MSADDYDIGIIGGGIHGAGVAQAAAAAGYRVVLLEQAALASGTSSRSSKLIHGGLRYLESAQIALVRESLREREILLRLAPKLVRLVPFYIPVYQSTARRPWQIRLGLSAYAMLTGLTPHARFESIPRDQWHGLDGLETKDLQHVFRYWDAQTDDAELTRAVMHSAISLGAELLCPARVCSVQRTDEGFSLRYQIAGQEHMLGCRALVNAAGPWVNHVLDLIEPTPCKRPIELVQGTHIEVRGALRQGVYYVEASDRRGVLMMPWRGHTLVGTTEHAYVGDPAKVHPLDHEVDYLLRTLQRYFPSHGASIVHRFAGLRVLPKSESPAFHRPRETHLQCDDQRTPSLITIYGGKLTAYRATAARLVARLHPVLGKPAAKANTRELPLSPAP